MIHRYLFRIVAIEIPGGKRNLNMNINAQQVILNAYMSKLLNIITCCNNTINIVINIVIIIAINIVISINIVI